MTDTEILGEGCLGVKIQAFPPRTKLTTGGGGNLPSQMMKWKAEKIVGNYALKTRDFRKKSGGGGGLWQPLYPSLLLWMSFPGNEI